ncbi:zinc fingers and homeoboxes protein 3 isoform 1-T2 [Synchiropus picturatus]
MASKRKSTVPCMIPSKSKHVREEIILGSLPELLPTIPEDSILSISGEESGHCSRSSTKSECSEVQKGGTYSCPLCHFESRDLNYFLDHMHNCHLDFRAQPTFYCLNCGESVVRFEALALHNAKAHPKIMEGSVTASLTVNMREGVTTVEQSLFTENGEDHHEPGIIATKTPIAKMMKGKGEHKKIVVSHTVEVRKLANGKDVDPSILTNVPELKNGVLSLTGPQAMPRSTVTNPMTTTVPNPVFHQHTPALYSPPSSEYNKDLPKVMIPLSSIPTYDAAMDTSSFLKTSFGKFPYPTKAELCYLTVVSEFPEEQIKLWFTAQRLKQGISWSPEEIEEARRKMFNTVFQGGAVQKPTARQHSINHIVSHHTVTAQPGSKGPNFPLAKNPFGHLKSRAGVVATQASLSTNPNVTRVSYSTPVFPQKIPSVVRTTQVLSKNSQPSAEPDKRNNARMDAVGSNFCVSNGWSSSSSSTCSSSSSSITSYSSNSAGLETVVRRPKNNSSPTDISNNVNHVAQHVGKSNATVSSLQTEVGSLNNSKSQEFMENTSKANITCNNHSSGALSPKEPDSKTDNECNNHFAQTSNSSTSSEQPSKDSGPSINHTSKPQTESTSTTVFTKGSPSVLQEGQQDREFSIKGMSILQQLIKDDDLFTGDRSSQEPRLDPIKFNFKRLKMNEAEQTTAEIVHQEPKSESHAEAPACQPSFSPPWSNKNPQQLQVLRQVFSSTRWPSSQQYEELSVQTGLPKSEVVRWFSDSRYSHKNGQLKWLDTYQRLPFGSSAEETPRHGDGQVESPKDSQAAKLKLGEQVANKHLEEETKPHSGQQGVWQDSYPPLLSLMESKGSGERGRAEGAVAPGVSMDSWSEGGRDHQQPVANQTLMEQPDANQARDGLRMELLEV